MVMEKEFLPYEIALELKELGFDEPCYKGYTEDYKELISFSNTHTNTSVKTTLPTKPFTTPLYQQVFRWFREKHNLNSFVIDSKSYSWYFNINDMVKDDVISEVLYFRTYEEAELECLKKLIEIVKDK
jgi:hypothetical protein